MTDLRDVVFALQQFAGNAGTHHDTDVAILCESEQDKIRLKKQLLITLKQDVLYGPNDISRIMNDLKKDHIQLYGVTVYFVILPKAMREGPKPKAYHPGVPAYQPGPPTIPTPPGMVRVGDKLVKAAKFKKKIQDTQL